MKAASETYGEEDPTTGLNREIHRILMKIHHAWQQSGQHEVAQTAAVADEEMETVVIPADLEPLHPVSSGADDLPETIMQSTLKPPDDECLEETVLLPPRKDHLKPGRTR